MIFAYNQWFNNLRSVFPSFLRADKLFLHLKHGSMKLQNFLFLILLCSLQQSLIAQKGELETAKLAVDTLFFSDKEKALQICEEKLPLALKFNDTNYITYFLDQAGEINRYMGNLYDAKRDLKRCLQFKKNWKDLKDLSLTHNNLGKTYLNMGNYEQALFHFLEALKLMEKDENLIGQGYYLNNIGTLFDLQHNYLKAIEYYDRSLRIKKQINDSSGVASTTLNIGISYHNLKKYDKAINYFKQSLQSLSYQQEGNKKARAYMNIGKAYRAKNDLESARVYTYKAYALQKEIDDQFLLMGIINALTSDYLAANVLDSAVHYNRIALELTQQSGASEKLQEALFLKAEIFEKQGLADSALIYLKQGNLYYDSLVTEASINAVAEMESKYHNERNLRLRQKAELTASKANESLQQKKLELLYIVILLLLIVGAGVFIFIKYRLNKRNADLLEGQNALMRKQNTRLEELNSLFSSQLSSLKITLSEKEEILQKVFTRADKNDQLPDSLLSLSPREMEILSNLALGLSDDQLASKLFVSKATVKTHLRRIFSKLLVRNRAEAVAIAHKYNIIGEAA